MLAGTVLSLIAPVARRNPRAVALLHGEREVNYGQILDNAARLASVLRERLAPGDRVAVLARNCPEYVEIYLGLQMAGLVAVPINFRFVASEFQYVMRNSGARGLLIGEEYLGMLDEVRAELPDLEDRSILVIGASAPTGYAARLARAQPASWPPPDPFAPAVIYYTSGTTGFPKGAVMSGLCILSRVIGLGWELGATSRDVMLVPGPMFHLSFSMMTLIPLCLGGRVVIVDEFRPESILETISRRNVTRSFMVPKMHSLLTEAMAGSGAHRYSGVEHLLSSGSALPHPVFEALVEHFPNARIAESMGWTESGWIVYCPFEDMRRKNLSAGRPAFGCDLAILDPDGNELPTGEVGQISGRPPVSFIGYHDNAEATALMKSHGWETGGDIGYRDDEGFLYILDRKRDIIISGGENIYPAELERVVAMHPDVLEVTAVGVPDERWGEAPRLCVVLKPGRQASAEEILGLCEGKLARYKLPRSVEFLEALPRNSMGKVLRRELRERFWNEETPRT